MTNMSRRSVAKGAAWSVPAVAVATSAPALAASEGTVTCPPASSLTLQPASAISVSSILVGDGTYSGGTSYTISAGQWNVPAGTTSNGQTVTGYYLIAGATGVSNCSNGIADAQQVAVTTGDNKSYVGKVTASTPAACSPQTAGAGLATNITLQTSVPYNGLAVCSNSMNLKTVSIPVTVIYLNGTTPVYDSAGTGCSYHLNLTFATGGCQPNYVSSYSWS